VWGGPFIGAEAVADGFVRKHELRSRHVALFPGVYLPSHVKPTFAHRVEGAWLWSRRQGVVVGLAASRLYGAKWVDDEEPVELAWTNARPPTGIITSALRLNPGETVMLGRLPVSSLVRTAFDLARRPPLGGAVARLDALGAAAAFDCADVADVAASHPGVRGIRQVPCVLSLHDAGAESPRETWLRLQVTGAGFPRPRTQIPVRSGMRTYYLDMGWEDVKIAAEYDGDHHRTSPRQFATDIKRLEDLAALGWIVVRVAAGTPRDELVSRLRRAWAARTPSSLR
jgi:very-short-patch-repair endonuclease